MKKMESRVRVSIREQIKNFVEESTRKENLVPTPRELQKTFRQRKAYWKDQDGRQPYPEPKDSKGSHNPRTGALPKNNPKGGEKASGKSYRGKEKKQLPS